MDNTIHNYSGLRVISQPLSLLGVNLGTKMSIIKLNHSDLAIYSPIKLTDDVRRAVDSFGNVRMIIAPNSLHHLYLKEFIQAYPQADAFGSAGLIKKRRDLPKLRLLDKAALDRLMPHCMSLQIPLAKAFEETVLLHHQSKTLVVTDLAFHLHGQSLWERFVLNLYGMNGKFGPTIAERMMVRKRHGIVDPLVQKIMTWDFERVVMAHGRVVEHGGREAFTKAFSSWRAVRL